uniref:A4_EXTRA domain-containing protein n=1 Tax=Globodera pallida TaxID=36090 RepID=A0A183C4B5_GLOPA
MPPSLHAPFRRLPFPSPQTPRLLRVPKQLRLPSGRPLPSSSPLSFVKRRKRPVEGAQTNESLPNIQIVPPIRFALQMPQLLAASLLLFFLLSTFAAGTEEPGSSSSGTSKKHEHFMPLVAFQCGYRNKFMNAEGRWQDDPSSVASCLHGKYDVLKYCKRVYPGEQISNIVEYSHLTRIGHWCREDGSDCHHQFTVRPFRCIAGEFVTESLQVPNRCHFSHIAGKDKCNDYKFWNSKSDQECAKKKDSIKGQPMRPRSFAILEPCGLGMFRGVEFVCCPRDLEERIEKVVDLEAEVGKLKSSSNDNDDEEEDDDDEEYDDEDEEEDEKSVKKESADAKAEQDPYFKDDLQSNEHERFREAEERLEKRHRKKEKDPKGAEQYKRNMTAKFRKTVAALEAENKEQRKQIEELHDERVQTALNEKKRQATHEYRAALAVQVGQANKQNVLRTLKNYIRAEEKDRQHMLNRYRHLLRSDPEAAVSFEPVLLHRLRYIDLRINGTLAMLRDFPVLEKETRPLAIAFWKSYRRENTPEVLDELTAKKEGGRYLSDEERNERLIRLYKQNFERHHPGNHLTLKLQELAPKTKSKMATTSTVPVMTRKSMVVSLKDVLKERKTADEVEEDSDEDQFEEDEESEEKMTPFTTTTAAPKRVHVELLNGEEGKKSKTDKDKPAKLMTSKLSSSSSSSGSEESAEGEEEADEDEDNEATGEMLKADGEAKKKHLRVDIEPIVLAPAPGELVGDSLSSVSEKHHHHRLETAEDDESVFGRWLAQTNFLLGLVTLTLTVLAVVVLLRRRRNRHPGFIEVEVCTPEERHVTGMQVNGYENPTYSFFEGKNAC